MLNMALNECLENVRGLRPEEEIAELIKVTDVIKTSNPQDEWQSLGKLGEGGQAQVFKVKHQDKRYDCCNEKSAEFTASRSA